MGCEYARQPPELHHIAAHSKAGRYVAIVTPGLPVVSLELRFPQLVGGLYCK